jgi:GntP family gluconate:H+ symporter
MTPADYRLVAAAVCGIALSIVLIIRGRLHPFVGLLCGAFAVGLLAGLPMDKTADAIEKGTGSILGGTGLVVALGLLEPARVEAPTPPVGRALTAILLPVVLIAAGQAVTLLPAAAAAQLHWLTLIGHPVAALLVATLAALPLLFGRRMFDASIQDAIWAEAMVPAGGVLLAIGAGGALKQVLVSAGLSDMLVRLAAGGAISPLLLAWGLAVCIRLATGSATVATITAAGMMKGLVTASGVEPEWVVLAIGAGSLFFSHVNDPGFWLVKSYVGTDMPGTFKTWSIMETVVAVVGLLLVLLGSTVL